jgi:hypothetical protein
MKRIYLSGGMTGYPELNYPLFNATAARLRSLGYDVVNPAEVIAEHPGVWESHMRADIAALLTCDSVALLDGWERPNGACLEVHIAMALGMKVCMAANVVAAEMRRVA